MNQRYVITGAPGTGKTSIIKALKKKGFTCINEQSRRIITEQIMKKGDILPWKNQIAFEKKIASIRTKKYLMSPPNEICFFDRSVLDCVAYLKLSKLKVPSEILKNIQKCKFNNIVFYTPFWKEIYINDGERKESIEIAIKIQKTIIEAYKSKNYQLIKIPKLSIKKRVDFIISKI